MVLGLQCDLLRDSTFSDSFHITNQVYTECIIISEITRIYTLEAKEMILLEASPRQNAATEQISNRI